MLSFREAFDLSQQGLTVFKNFIELTLKNKLKAVNKSILTRDLLGNFPIENCPECLSLIKPI